MIRAADSASADLGLASWRVGRLTCWLVDPYGPRAMPMEFLTDAQVAGYGRFDGVPSRAALERFFFLDDAAKDLLGDRRAVPEDRCYFAIRGRSSHGGVAVPRARPVPAFRSTSAPRPEDASRRPRGRGVGPGLVRLHGLEVHRIGDHRRRGRMPERAAVAVGLS